MTDKYQARSGGEIRRSLIAAEVQRLSKEMDQLNSKVLPNINDEQHNLIISNIAIQSLKETGQSGSLEYNREVIKNGAIKRRMESHCNAEKRIRVIIEEIRSLELENY